MNTREICSTLGVSLMLIAMLSMIAVPVLAKEEEANTSSNSSWMNCPCGVGKVTVYVDANWDTGSYSTSYSYGSSTAYVGQSSSTSSTLVFQEATGYCGACGRYLYAECWVSPPSMPNRSGGYATWWW
jgi:hypothetical protein